MGTRNDIALMGRGHALVGTSHALVCAREETPTSHALVGTPGKLKDIRIGLDHQLCSDREMEMKANIQQHV